MTPAPARDPYSDAAAAPFTISTLSISLALMSPSGFEPCRITPSTMYSGSWPRPVALIDVGPRRITDGVEPGRPLTELIVAPATLPCNCDRGFTPTTGICEESTRAT